MNADARSCPGLLQGAPAAVHERGYGVQDAESGGRHVLLGFRPEQQHLPVERAAQGLPWLGSGKRAA